MKKFIILFLALFLLVGCSKEQPKFKLGDMVAFKISPNITGMIVNSWCTRWQCHYSVRKYNVDKIKNIGDIKNPAYSITISNIIEYELIRVKNENNKKKCKL